MQPSVVLRWNMCSSLPEAIFESIQPTNFPFSSSLRMGSTALIIRASIAIDITFSLPSMTLPNVRQADCVAFREDLDVMQATRLVMACFVDNSSIHTSVFVLAKR